MFDRTSPMPRYKLVYFELAGRAELIRLALSAAKQPFEDVRLKLVEDWPKYKDSTPQGKLPILEVDGRVLCQTGAIVRYIAREYGLYGKDNVENTQVDIVLDTAEDMTPEIIKLAYENDPDKKKEYMQNFTGTVIPNFVRLFCNILCQNGDGNGWMVGSTLTVADLCVFGLFNSLEGGSGPDAVQALYNDAKLKALYDRVAQVEEIKHWLEKRPKSF